MRATRSLLAAAARSQPAAGMRLTPGAPTGLTGFPTHPSPRPHLIYLYKQTLQKLSALPETSVYRQSAEAVTRHRLAIIEGAKPEGLEAWQQRLRSQMGEHAGAVRERAAQMASGDGYLPQSMDAKDDRYDDEWDGEVGEERAEGVRTARGDQAKEFGSGLEHDDLHKVHVVIEDEPALTAAQVNDVEQKIGAGLLEEIVAVAEGELALVDTMSENKVWEELEEKPVEGQWDYFQRDRNVGTTQAP